MLASKLPGVLLYEYVQFDGFEFYSDTVASGDPTFTFPHTGSDLTVDFIASGDGWQGIGDEAYAIDNSTVTVGHVAVPEPSSCALLAMSLVGFDLRRQ
jgi:hypothetical protein